MTDFESGSREEVRWAETDQADETATNDMTVLPHGGSLSGPSRQFERGPSDEVRSDLTVNDNPVRGWTVPFSIQNVVRFGIYDLPVQQVFNGRWSTPAFDTGVLTDVQSVATGNKLVAAAGTPFADLTNLLPAPVWIVRGGADAIPGQPVVATEVLASGAELVLETDGNNGLTLTDVAAGDDVQVMLNGVIKNGVEHIFALIERAQLGLTHFHGGFGMAGTSLSFNGQKGQDPTFQIDWMGLNAAAALATHGNGTVNAANGNKAFNFGSNLKHFRENGAIVADLFLQSLQWQFQSGVGAIDPAGIDGPKAHQKNRIQVSGSANFFSNTEGKGVGDRADSAADSSIYYALQRTDGGVTNAYVKWLPLIQYTQGPNEGGGSDNPVTTNTSFETAKSPTYGCQICMARFADVPLTL